MQSTEDGKIVFVGGNFWDGRATGEKLGNPAADQAQGPFLNPVEQNIADAKTLVEKVCRSEYSDMFKKVGNDIWKIKDICAVKDVDLQFDIIGIAIAAFENSGKVNEFSSKFDQYLRGKVKLSAKEQKGLELFRGKAKCAECHSLEKGKTGLIRCLLISLSITWVCLKIHRIRGIQWTQHLIKTERTG